MQDESRHHAPVAAFSLPAWRTFPRPLQTDWYRGIALFGFTQRRLALFSLAALCVWRVDAAPNDPVLAGGAAGGGRALMRTWAGIPAAIGTDVGRIRCPITQIFRYGLTKRHRAGTPSPTIIPPLCFRQGARKPPVRAWHHPDQER